MKLELINVLQCPVDGTFPMELRASVESQVDIQSGWLVCPTCGSRFEIASGIPRLLILDGGPESEVSRREIESRGSWRRQNPGAAPGRTLQDFLELDALRAAVGECAGLRVLDAGCGWGRTTEAVRAADNLVGLDFSFENLRLFDSAISDRIELVEGNVCQLPFRAGAFDAAVSSQVLEHVPSEKLRRKAVSELARVLRPGGRLAISAYNWDKRRQRNGIPKEGYHGDGIFYHCYDPAELVEELASCFEVEAVWGVDATLPGMWWLSRFPRGTALRWERLYRQRGWVLPYSKVLLVVARKAFEGRRSTADP